MSAAAVLSDLQAAGGSVRLVKGQVKVTIPAGAESMLPVLREHKAEIIEILSRSEPIPPSASIPEDDPAAWRDAFEDWLLAECVIHPRCFGGIGCLHLHFCDWAIAHDAVPCTRRTFERLLADSGFLMADGMVSELILKEDWDACHQPGRETP